MYSNGQEWQFFLPCSSHLPSYTASYSYPGGGKQGQANALAAANPSPSLPTACIGMSAGADACVLNAIDRLDQGLLTTHLVLIGGTFNSEARPGFSYWETDLKRLMDSGTKILVVNDASIASVATGDSQHEDFKYLGYTLGDVPYSQNNYSILPHHSSNICDTCIGANNSPALASSVYTWITTGDWSWEP